MQAHWEGQLQLATLQTPRPVLALSFLISGANTFTGSLNIKSGFWLVGNGTSGNHNIVNTMIPASAAGTSKKLFTRVSANMP